MQKPYTLIIPSWYPTGSQPLNGIFIEKHVAAISGFENVVIMYVTGAEKDALLEEKVSESYTRYICTYAESKSRLINQLKYVLAQKKAYEHITAKYGKPSRLHLQVVFPAGIFVYLLLLFQKIPLIITEHWSGYTAEDGRYQRQMWLFKYLTKKLFEKAGKISVVSGYLKNAIVKQGLCSEDKLMIVSNILNTSDKSIAEVEVQSPKALFIGNLNDHEKNLSALITAVSMLSKKYSSLELTIVGGGAEADKFKEIARKEGVLDKNIFFKGYVPNSELSPIYKAHSFFILTSNFETFNIAAAEALLSGLPVVSTMCGGPAEYINTQNGVWIRNNTAHGIAAGIASMIENRANFDSAAIASEISKKYGYDSIVQQLKKLYEA